MQQGLLEAIRKACLPGLWSQGVKLAREGAAFGREDRDDAVVIRVKAAGQPVAPTVTLYPADAEWTCDCGGKVDPCAHAVAAAISLSQPAAQGAQGQPAPAGQAQGQPAAQGSAPAGPAARAARLRYRLRRKGLVLALERMIVLASGAEEPLRVSLASLAGRGARGPVSAERPGPRLPELYPTHEDLAVDRLVGQKQHGYFPSDRQPELFAALAGAADVELDGAPIRVSSEAIGPRAAVRDHDDGVVLVVERDPRIDEVIASGVVRCGDTLHLLRETDLTGPKLERLPLRRGFSRGDLGKLVTQVLPELKKRVPVTILSQRLPRAGGASRPRIQLDLSQKDHTLSVVPTLVYGDPPEARIENGRLVHLSGPVPIRDEAAERELLARLRDELHLIPGRRVDFDGAEAIRFASRLEAWDARAFEGARGELFGRAELAPRFVIRDRAFDVEFELSAGPEGDGEGEGGEGSAAPPRRADAAAVIRAWQDGLPLVPLLGGGWAPLPAAWLERYGARVADLLAARRDDKEVPPAALPALAALCDELELPRPSGFDRLMPLLDGFASLPEAPLPADLTATLRPYQRRGVDWLSFLRDAGLGGVLADDMGLGKTLQTLCAVRGRTLVVCPRSVVHNWADEIRRFRPGLRHAIYHGSKRALDPAADVTLTTYAVLRNDVERLAAQAWDVVVLDEAQAIKNPDSQAARAAYALRAELRIALSGTPVENRLEELWSLLHFTNRGLLGGRGAFQERYGRPIADGAAGAAAELRQRIRPFVLRRMKREVAPELPPRSDTVLYCELEEAEREVYEAVRAATRKDVVAKLAAGASVMAALEALLRLRQAACHPALIPGSGAGPAEAGAARAPRTAPSSKVTRLLEALEECVADGHKALVFSQWTSLLDLVEPHLTAAAISFVRLDGATRDRAGVVGAFQSAGGPPVMLISLKAGGTGLNLTAADHVFLLDPWWNPAVEDQAADRAHRIGQDRPVLVHRLVAKDTVEEGILALQEQKRAIAGAALGEADRAVSLTREDLLALLG
ncbi:DEAD/DEAH box helicase [Sorangium sp. So ce1036]|uniref:DEAD/DEAH box helicase n=1 Tax=Sorangium sp. So ce1036 TaxID=3133328 RepID=UPI003EFBF579